MQTGLTRVLLAVIEQVSMTPQSHEVAPWGYASQYWHSRALHHKSKLLEFVFDNSGA